MRSSIKYLGLLSIFSAMTVMADTPSDAPAPTAKPATALSVEDMKTQSAGLVAENETSYRELLHLKELAKKQKDVIKLNCINDKLVQIKAQITIAEETNTELQGALASSSDERFSIYTRLSTQSAAVTQSRDEGRACIGTPELFKQEAGLDVIRPDIIDDPGDIDPYGDDTLGGNDLDPPGYASPFN
jgi:hypothetical protein